MDKDQPTSNAPRPPRPGGAGGITAKPPQPSSQEAIISRIKSEAQKSKAILEQQNIREQQRQDPNPASGLEKAVGTATRAAEASSDLVKRLRQEKKQR